MLLAFQEPSRDEKKPGHEIHSTRVGSDHEDPEFRLKIDKIQVCDVSPFPDSFRQYTEGNLGKVFCFKDRPWGIMEALSKPFHDAETEGWVKATIEGI